MFPDPSLLKDYQMPTIKTNNVPRDILYPYQLTMIELAEFDYLIGHIAADASDELKQEAWCDSGATFVRYRGELYDLAEFIRIVPKGASDPNGFAHHDLDGSLAKWQGIRTDSYFSGLVLRYAGDDWESVVIGLLLC